jgi:predicted nuclease of predicted toxin-antitoxin system
MKFIVDAQLPKALARFCQSAALTPFRCWTCRAKKQDRIVSLLQKASW